MKTEPTSGRLFVLFDARARSGDTDAAVVLDTAESEREARSRQGAWPKDSIWYEYKPIPGKKDEVEEVGARYDIKC